MTEKEKMLQGELYRSNDPELKKCVTQSQLLYQEYNQTLHSEEEKRTHLLKQLLGIWNKELVIIPPFYCDYGFNIHMGEEVFMNVNCCILDVVPVHIGNRVLTGPSEQINTATHPLSLNTRQEGLEYGNPLPLGMMYG